MNPSMTEKKKKPKTLWTAKRIKTAKAYDKAAVGIHELPEWPSDLAFYGYKKPKRK